MAKPCPRPLRGCKYDPPFASNHHKWWPKDQYTTPLEKAFRTAEVNIERDICRCMHDLEHCKRPPRKPSIAFMKRFLGR